MTRFGRVAIQAALESGRLIRRSVGKVRDISFKGRDNIVTDVDKASERLIVRRIRAAFPGHAILAEEGGRYAKRSSYTWIIDPLDGTTNFAHAFPFFCVSIGLDCDGSLLEGVVYDPMRGELFRAASGEGAYLNGRRIRVSGTGKVSQSFLATGFSYGITRKDRNIAHFKKLLPISMAIRRAGSAALDLSYVACGRFDGYWELGLHPWDCAAGQLIVQEAGGRVTRFDGTCFSRSDRNILATNGIIHPEMVKIIG